MLSISILKENQIFWVDKGKDWKPKNQAIPDGEGGIIETTNMWPIVTFQHTGSHMSLDLLGFWIVDNWHLLNPEYCSIIYIH